MKAVADIGEVRADRLCRQNLRACRDRTRQRQRPIEEFADLADQRKRRQHAGMSARARAHRDQAIRPLLQRLVREHHVDDVVQHDAAVGMDRVIDVRPCAQRRDHDRYFMFHAQREVFLDPVVRLVDDQVHRIGRDLGRRIGLARRRQLFVQLRQPFVQLLDRPRIQRRERPDHARLALGQHKVWPRDDEQGRPDHRNRKLVRKRGRNRHEKSPRWNALPTIPALWPAAMPPERRKPLLPGRPTLDATRAECLMARDLY